MNDACTGDETLRSSADMPEKEVKLPKSEILKRHEVRISFFHVGCIISVGCKTVAFNNVDDAMKALVEYVADPETSEKKWVYEMNK